MYEKKSIANARGIKIDSVVVYDALSCAVKGYSVDDRIVG
jgi:hypothetical protein